MIVFNAVTVCVCGSLLSATICCSLRLEQRVDESVEELVSNRKLNSADDMFFCCSGSKLKCGRTKMSRGRQFRSFTEQGRKKDKVFPSSKGMRTKNLLLKETKKERSFLDTLFGLLSEEARKVRVKKFPSQINRRK